MRRMDARRLFGIWLCCASSLPAAALAQLAPDPDPERPRLVEVQQRVEDAFQSQDRVNVFILLREGALPLEQSQASVIDQLGSNFEAWHRYKNIPAIAGELSSAGLTQLRAHALVLAVQLDGTGSGGLAEALPAVGVDQVQSVRGLTGKGVTVAVIDSGASTQHPALKGAIVGQHCFTQNACPPSNARESESAEDDHNHGSNVTGIVASRSGGGVSKGYAPAASIVAVKVLNRNNAGQVSDWVAGFDWVFSNLSKLNIKVINASLVSTAEYADAASCDRSETALAAITKKLVDAGVTITASSGNTGHVATMTAPACNTGVIAVGATYDADLGRQPGPSGTYASLGGSPWPACADATSNTKTIACFTSTAGKRLDLLAPGSQISSAGKGTGKSMFRGTSQAAPGVAGLAALLLECNGMLTPAKILNVLTTTGEPVMDPRSGMSYPLIRGMQAVEAACPSTTGGAAGVGSAAGSGSAGAMSGAAGAGPALSTAGMPAAVGGGGIGASGMPAGTVTANPAGPLMSTAGVPAPPLAGSGLPGASTGQGTMINALTAAGAGATTVQVPRASASAGCSSAGVRSHGNASGLVLAFGLVALSAAKRRRLRSARPPAA